MRPAMPPLTEQADERTRRLPREHDGHQTPRLQRLARLASGQTRICQAVARLLGVHRQTIGRCLAIDAAGGLETVRPTSVPAGQPIWLAPTELASLEEALH